ncbi:phosphatidylserine decarboxylase protein [Rutstroemia sp. NJR-2017a BBW]|nr:phosphatidylserine decarboxylase protein [Rutstroemia sp. NJR-2017a BBW]
MDRFRGVQNGLARKRSKPSLRRKRSDTSIYTETTQTRTPSDQHRREQKSAPYRHPRYEGQLQERSSFMKNHDDGITIQSKKTCDSLRGENETKVILRIGELIFPSAEVLALRGAKHLPRLQPDFGLGFKREAFIPEQLRKLSPFIGNEIEDCSYIAATYNMYLPFFTSEVKCGASALDIADRKNLHSQTVALRQKVELFRLVGRLDELHREVNGFSISHSDEYVRIWAHYVVVKGEDVTFHRHPIAKFDISPTEEGDQRWKAWNFVMNVFEFWVPDHFKRLCSAIDMLPADLNFDISELDQDMTSSRSGLSQRFDNHSLANEQVAPDSQSSVQQITPPTTIEAQSSDPKKKRTQ